MKAERILTGLFVLAVLTAASEPVGRPQAETVAPGVKVTGCRGDNARAVSPNLGIVCPEK